MGKTTKKRRFKLFEKFQGCGPVRRKGGKSIGVYEYDLRVYQEVFDDEIRGIRDIRGSIKGLDEVGLAQSRAELTLDLEGGKKRLGFRIKSDGGITPIGDFFDVTE